MRFFMILIVLVLIVAGVGYYRGWFNVSSDTVGDTVDLELSVDKDKIRQDEHKAAEAVNNLGH